MVPASLSPRSSRSIHLGKLARRCRRWPCPRMLGCSPFFLPNKSFLVMECLDRTFKSTAPTVGRGTSQPTSGTPHPRAGDSRPPPPTTITGHHCCLSFAQEPTPHMRVKDPHLTGDLPQTSDPHHLPVDQFPHPSWRACGHRAGGQQGRGSEARALPPEAPSPPAFPDLFLRAPQGTPTRLMSSPPQTQLSPPGGLAAGLRRPAISSFKHLSS